LQIDKRHKAQGARHKEESTALFITIPVGASFACDRRIYELRDFGFRISDFGMKEEKRSLEDTGVME
jgi:hypothetical protein